MRSKHARVAVALALSLGVVRPAGASPTMIRLGYASCAACHVSPQGTGLLTDYGKGIDLAQSLLVREYEPPPKNDGFRLRQDLRGYIGYQYAPRLAPVHTPSTTLPRNGSSAMDAQVWHRAAISLNARHRFSSTLTVDGWADDFVSTDADPKVVVTKALWEFRPRENLEVAVGRDVLPSGLENSEHQRELRRGITAGARTYPSQAKLFWWTDRVQVTPYVFGPTGRESKDARQYGAGALAALVGFRQHAVVGVSARTSHMTGGDEQRFGTYARLGFGTWGVLAEHEWIDRRVSDPLLFSGSGFAGLTQVFAVPREWLVLTLGGEYVALDGKGTYTYRLLPSVQVRVSDKLTIVAGPQSRFTDPDRVQGRSFSVQLYLKTGT
jgi:hypothetical protein